MQNLAVVPPQINPLVEALICREFSLSLVQLVLALAIDIDSVTLVICNLPFLIQITTNS